MGIQHRMIAAHGVQAKQPWRVGILECRYNHISVVHRRTAVRSVNTPECNRELAIELGGLRAVAGSANI